RAAADLLPAVVRGRLDHGDQGRAGTADPVLRADRGPAADRDAAAAARRPRGLRRDGSRRAVRQDRAYRRLARAVPGAAGGAGARWRLDDLFFRCGVLFRAGRWRLTRAEDLGADAVQGLVQNDPQLGQRVFARFGAGLPGQAAHLADEVLDRVLQVVQQADVGLAGRKAPAAGPVGPGGPVAEVA